MKGIELGRVSPTMRNSVSALVLLACVVVAGLAVAAPGAAVRRVIQYDGYLEQGGVAVSRTVQAAFTLYDGPEGAETQSVRYPAIGTLVLGVTAGRFSLPLGEGAPLPNWVFDLADNVYMSMVIDGVALAGRQRIVASPFAVRASEATTFTVKQRLEAADILITSGANSNIPSSCEWVFTATYSDRFAAVLCPAGKSAASGACQPGRDDLLAPPTARLIAGKPVLLSAQGRAEGWGCEFDTGAQPFTCGEDGNGCTGGQGHLAFAYCCKVQ
jgi:hypothetical protein